MPYKANHLNLPLGCPHGAAKRAQVVRRTLGIVYSMLTKLTAWYVMMLAGIMGGTVEAGVCWCSSAGNQQPNSTYASLLPFLTYDETFLTFQQAHCR